MTRNLILGGGGFIGGALGARLKAQGEFVRVVDIKAHAYRDHAVIADEFILGDLRDSNVVDANLTPDIDVVFQLAADMGGAGYIFTGDHDADVMHNSAQINLNVVKRAADVCTRTLFYSSSACVYPKHNQLDPSSPNCAEDSAYPANPDSEYGWEKLFSERLYQAFHRNRSLNVKIARFHNIFGPYGVYDGGREKAPAAILRKVLLAKDSIEIWGDGQQTRSFLYIDDCLDAVTKLVLVDTFHGPVNIGSEEMVTINGLADLAMQLAGKQGLKIVHIPGPEGVRGRCSHNRLVENVLGWTPKHTLAQGMLKTHDWIKSQLTEV